MTLSLVDPWFLGVLAAVIVLRSVAGARWPGWLSIVAGVALVGIASPITLLIVGGTAALIVYPAACAIRHFKHESDRPGAARWVLGAGVVAVLGVWALVKGSRELGWDLLSGEGGWAQIGAVVGFSYFIFRGINVLFIHWLANMPESGPWRIVYFSIFPTTISSGPIQKYTEFCRDLTNPLRLSFHDVCEAVYRITLGYFFKICMSPLAQGLADEMILVESKNAYTSIVAIVALYVFVFFDFAGYSHIAIGLGRLLGVRVPENFKHPFRSTSVTEFWRNWHVTIGDWFRDHVFIPTGSMRAGGRQAAVVAACIMLICGLWHGFTWTFLAWGVWHAGLLLYEGLTGTRPMPPAERRGPRFWLRVASTNAKIAFGAVFFIPAPDDVIAVLSGLTVWL